jgi:hypothetical protein
MATGAYLGYMGHFQSAVSEQALRAAAVESVERIKRTRFQA